MINSRVSTPAVVAGTLRSLALILLTTAGGSAPLAAPATCLVATAAIAASQDQLPAASASAEAGPLSATTKRFYGGVKGRLLGAAEKMPEENYTFRPTDSERTFGQQVGHLADSQYFFCSLVLGEKNPAPKIEQTKTGKAELVAALKDACGYCDKAYDSMTDGSATQIVKFHGQDTPKLGVLTANLQHNMNHYGQLVVYLRLKNIVPPTSDPEFMEKVMEHLKK